MTFNLRMFYSCWRQQKQKRQRSLAYITQIRIAESFRLHHSNYLSSQSVLGVVKPRDTIQAETQSKRAHKPIISLMTLSGHASYFVRVTQVYLKIWVVVIAERWGSMHVVDTLTTRESAEWKRRMKACGELKERPTCIFFPFRKAARI